MGNGGESANRRGESIPARASSRTPTVRGGRLLTHFNRVGSAQDSAALPFPPAPQSPVSESGAVAGSDHDIAVADRDDSSAGTVRSQADSRGADPPVGSDCPTNAGTEKPELDWFPPRTFNCRMLPLRLPTRLWSPNRRALIRSAAKGVPAALDFEQPFKGFLHRVARQSLFSANSPVKFSSITASL